MNTIARQDMRRPAGMYRFLILATALLSGCLNSPAKDDLEVYGAAPRIQLTDQRGNGFDSRTLDGKVWAFTSFFTSCPSTCPALLGQLKRVEQDLGAGREVHFVLLSVDPETDTAEQLSRFAADKGLDPSRWTLLTGERQQIVALLNDGFRLGGGETPSMHSARVALVDGRQQVRGFFDGTDTDSTNALRAGIEGLLGR